MEYRSQQPEEETEKDVLKELKDNNIDVREMVEWTADHCQQAESSMEGENAVSIVHCIHYMQYVVPEIEIKCNGLEYHTFVSFSLP